jgi:hypothetical protein
MKVSVECSGVHSRYLRKRVFCEGGDSLYCMPFAHLGRRFASGSGQKIGGATKSFSRVSAAVLEVIDSMESWANRKGTLIFERYLSHGDALVTGGPYACWECATSMNYGQT